MRKNKIMGCNIDGEKMDFDFYTLLCRIAQDQESVTDVIQTP